VSHPDQILGSLRLSIVQTIAKGGMGQVYRAIQHGVEGFGKTVALKTILEPYAADEEFVRMFIAEAKLVADLVHQNIVQVYHLGRAEGILYMVMEYVDGVNLRQILDRHAAQGRRLPVELAAFFASRVCRGLEHAHAQTDAEGIPLGIVHRDVSPRNLLTTRFGEVKICDFGVAKARSLAMTDDDRRVLGKYAYLSPEQARREPTDNRSDLFSLGLVLFEMLAGHRPFAAEVRSREAWLAHARVRPVPPVASVVPDVPPMLARIVDRAVAMEPTDRYADAGTMGYDLEYFMYHQGYGPTIVTLASHISKLFGGAPRGDAHPLDAVEPGRLAETSTSSG